MKRLALGLCALLGGCYSPDLSGVQFTCDSNNPICPDGLLCVSNVCRKSGVITDTDMGGSDGMMSVTGCRSGRGYKVGSAFACPGAFSPTMTASQLCGSGLQICQNSNGIDITACRALPGFFAAVRIHRDGGTTVNTGTIACGGPNGNQVRMYAGCGRMQQDTIYDLPGGVQQCSTFPQAIDCQQAGWQCPQSNLDSNTQTNANDGVLCC